MLTSPIVIDLRQSLNDWRTWVFLGWDDIGRRYQRSKLGPLWMTGGLGAMTMGIGLLYSQILALPLDDYLNFLAAGLATWLFISMQLTEACATFQSASGILKNYQLAKTTLVLRVLWRNLIAFGHHLVFVVVLALALGVAPKIEMLWLIPGLLILSIILFELSVILSILASRFRDVSQMITYFLQAAFFVTPIMWQPSSGVAGNKILTWNPFRYMVSLVRDPLVGEPLSFEIFLGGALLVVALAVIAIPVYAWGRTKVVFWI